MKQKRKRYIVSRVICAVLIVIFVALGVFLGVWFFGADYSEFDALSTAEAALPDLSDGFVPQGTCALNENAAGFTYAVSGYYGGAPSRIYLLGDGEPAYITVKENGEELTTHFGGVAATDNYLFVASEKDVVRLPLASVYAQAANNGAVEVLDALETDMGIAFVSVYGDTLLAGEFYRAGNYETDLSHHITVNDETNRALVYCYTIDESAEGGVTDKTPYAAISVRDLVQGIAVTDTNIYISCSWGLADSGLYCYRNILSQETELTVTVNGKSVPLHFLGESELVSSLKKVPSMSEGIFVKDNKLFVLFESKCNKYKYFVRRQTGDLLSLPLTAFGG